MNSYFNLQYFAEPVEPTNEPPADDKTFTQEQVNDIIQKRLAKEKAKLEKQYEQKIKEIHDLSILSEEQRKKLDTKLMAIEERERQIKISEDRIECENVLRTRGLNPSFANFLLCDGAEQTLERINEFEDMFYSMVKAEVDKRINGNKRKIVDYKTYTAVSKEEFEKLTLYEQNKLYLSNPELYKNYFK